MSRDSAKGRFIAIQTMRWIGLALAAFGLLVIYRRIDLMKEAGYVLFLVGLFGSLIAPNLLARRWKSPPS